MTRAVLSLGSNLGDSAALLRAAVDSFGPAVQAVSGLYATPPWGGIEQPDFLNVTVIVEDPDTDATGWLARCQAAERAADRTREVRWGPRTLDADVITVDDIVQDDPVLTLPHPRAAERAFVLVPWLSIDADAVLPGHGRVDALLSALDTSEIRWVGHARD